MQRRSHILFISSWYPNRQAPALGNFVQRHARAAALHHNVSVVYAASDPQLKKGEFDFSVNEEEHLLEVRVNYSKSTGGIALFTAWKKAQRYKKAIELGIRQATDHFGRPDLLHLHVAWPAGVAALPAAQKLNIPLLLSEHWSGYLPEDGNYRGVMMKRFTQQVVARAQHVTAVSQRMIAAMQAHGLKNEYSILPNVVDTGLFAPAAAMSAHPGLRLVHVSMLVDREKNISGILRVMSELKDRSDITLDIIGDGAERAQHEAQAQQLGILGKTVFFRGFKTSEEVAPAMRSADALLLFSHFEGMPVTIIEAQACGLPVIATRTGAIEEMVNEAQGLLVPCGDEKKLREAILEMAQKKNRYDAGAIRAQAVQRYSMASVAQQLNDLYTRILHRAR